MCECVLVVLQVLVVRVRSEEDLPATHPDIDYPAGTNFSSERDVNDPTRDSPLLGPYIAGQCVCVSTTSSQLYIHITYMYPIHIT